MPNPPTFNFNYTAYKNPNLSVDRLDAIAGTVFQPAANSNMFSRILSCILLGFALAYIIARKIMVDQDQQIQKQQYEQSQTSSNQSEVNNQQPKGAS